jgi:glycosyltransferase involved in cell wall biosynthesis
MQNANFADKKTEAQVEVSVIIPAFNAAKFLRQAVGSVLEQTQNDLEIIIVDDGSVDETPEIAKSFDERVRYFRKENGGITSARNLGLREAKGEFIASLDADDYFLSPTKLGSQIAVMKKFDDCGLVLSGWLNVDENGVEIEKREPWKYAPRLDLKDMVTWSPFLPSVMLFRRAALESIGGFNPDVRIIEDFDVVTRLIIAGFTAKWLPEVTTAYRLHDKNITRNLSDMEKETEDYLTKFFLNPELPPDVKKIERRLRFSTRIRIAFKYFEAENFAEMKRCLLGSVEFSDLASGAALLYWAESFRGYDPKINMFKLLDSKHWRELTDIQLDLDAH